MSAHLGGFDCKICNYNDKRREGLKEHYAKIHKAKMDNTLDYCHLTKAIRIKMEECAKKLAHREVKMLPSSNQEGGMVSMATVQPPSDTSNENPANSELMPIMAVQDQEEGNASNAMRSAEMRPSTSTSSAHELCQRQSFLDVLAFIKQESDSSEMPSEVMKTPDLTSMENDIKEHPDTPMEEDIVIMPSPLNLDNYATVSTPTLKDSVRAVELKIVDLKSISDTVESLRESNLPLYLYLVAEFHAKSMAAVDMNQKNLDIGTIIKELRDVHM
jgi:hypothetical protein